VAVGSRGALRLTWRRGRSGRRSAASPRSAASITLSGIGRLHRRSDEERGERTPWALRDGVPPRDELPREGCSMVHGEALGGALPVWSGAPSLRPDAWLSVLSAAGGRGPWSAPGSWCRVRGQVLCGESVLALADVDAGGVEGDACCSAPVGAPQHDEQLPRGSHRIVGDPTAFCSTIRPRRSA
jgi:hypothetical protein